MSQPQKQKQTVLPFDYVEENQGNELTAWAGVGLFLELTMVVRLRDMLDKTMDRGDGWPVSVIVMTIILINLVGGQSVDDVAWLQADKGLSKFFELTIMHGLRGKERERLQHRIDAAGTPFPSPSSIFRYLNQMHDPAHNDLHEDGVGVIIPESQDVKQLWSVMDMLTRWFWARAPLEEVDLDIDATLNQTAKREAKFSYKKTKAYQPLNFWIAQQHWMLYSQFRDGNVAAGAAILDALKEALERVPDAVKRLAIRSDSAGHVNELLRYCEEGMNERFGRIYFAVSAKLSQSLRKDIVAVAEDDWTEIMDNHPLPGEKPTMTGQQWVEVNHVPDALSKSKSGEYVYRFIAIRTPMQNTLDLDTNGDGSKDQEQDDDAHEQTVRGQRYKYTALITNYRDPNDSTRDTDLKSMHGVDVIHYLRKRAGYSEHVHGTLKTDLAGGRMPSGRFGANSAWWAISIMTANLIEALKRFALHQDHARIKLKRLRFLFLNIAARVTSSGRRLRVRIAEGHPALPQLYDARARLAELAEPPPDHAMARAG